MRLLTGFFLFLSTFVVTPMATALSIDLGLADEYTVLSTGEASLAPGMMTIGSSADIEGNVGARGMLSVGPLVSITGDLNHGSLFSIAQGVDIGGSNQVLGASYWGDVYDDLLDASNAASALTAGSVVSGGINGTTTLDALSGSPSVYHVQGGISLGAGSTLTLRGGPQDEFIINVDLGMILGAGSAIQLDGVLAGNVLFNFTGSSYLGHAVTIGAASFDGTYIAPNIDWQFSPGSSMLQTRVLVSGIQGSLEDMTPPAVVPEPCTALLLAIGLVGMTLARRRDE